MASRSGETEDNQRARRIGFEMGLTTEQFEKRYLPNYWTEADLEKLVAQRITYRLSTRIVKTQTQIKCPQSNRRSDIETLIYRYEVKKYLTYDAIYHAVGQQYLYNHYGSKILGVIPKKRVIIGLTPVNQNEAMQAKKLATDFQKIGFEFVFINERPEWYPVAEGQRKAIIKGATIAAMIALVGGLGLGLTANQLFNAIKYQPYPVRQEIE